MNIFNLRYLGKNGILHDHRDKNIIKYMNLIRKRFFIIFASIMTCSAIAICAYLYHHQRFNKAIPKSSPHRVETSMVKVRDFSDQYQVHGSLMNRAQIDIVPQYSGIISAIHFKSGQQVKKGDSLISLDDTIARSELSAALAALKLSQMNFKRVEELAPRKMVSAQTYDQALAELRHQENLVHVAQDKVDKLCLKAPFSGVLTLNHLSVGQRVDAGEKLVRLIDNHALRVLYAIPERYIAQLQPGQDVFIATDALPAKTFHAKVRYVAPEIDPSTRSIEVEALLNNQKHLLSAGMFVQVTHHFGTQHARMLIPEESLIPTISGQKVFVLKGGKVQSVPVKTGVHHQGLTEIIKGLSTHDEVVVRGQSRLRDGSAVDVLNPSKRSVS